MQMLRTSQVPALLQVVDSLPPVALAHLCPDQSGHHALNPLLTDDSVLCALQGNVVLVVDAVKGGRNLWLLSQEHG